MSNSVSAYSDRIHLLPDKYDDSCCLSDTEPCIDDRKVAVLNLQNGMYLTYERFPEGVKWWQRFFCCLDPKTLPTTAFAVDVLSDYIIEEYGEIAFRLGQRLAEINLKEKLSILVSERKKLLEKVAIAKVTQDKIKMMMVQLKYYLLIDTIVEVTPSPQNRITLSPLLDDRSIVIKKGKNRTYFNTDKLLNTLKNISLFDKKEKEIHEQAFIDLIKDVEAAILRDNKENQVTITTTKLKEVVVREIKLRDFKISKPLIYKYLPSKTSPTVLTLSDDTLLAIHYELQGSPKSADSKIDC